MKVVTLTFDRNRPFYLNMLFGYRDLLPGTGFNFFLPRQDDLSIPADVAVTPVSTESSIKQTVLAQIRGLPDHEWVYWATDDRFLVDVDSEVFISIMGSLLDGEFDDYDGVLLNNKHASQGLVSEDYLVIDGGAQEIVFNLREDLMTVWLHQFLKVRVLRAIFETMPGDLRQAKSMDTHIRGLEKFFPVRRLQSQKSFIVLEESLSRGIPTAEGYRALQSRNLDIPRELRKVSLKALIQFGLRHRRLPFYLLR